MILHVYKHIEAPNIHQINILSRSGFCCQITFHLISKFIRENLFSFPFNNSFKQFPQKHSFKIYYCNLLTVCIKYGDNSVLGCVKLNFIHKKLIALIFA